MSSEERHQRQAKQASHQQHIPSIKQQSKNLVHVPCDIKSIATNGNNGTTSSSRDKKTIDAGVVEGCPLQSHQKTLQQGAPPSKRGKKERVTDTSTTVQAKTPKCTSGIVFGIAPLLVNICNYCDVLDIVKFRAIDSNFNQQLAFSFDCKGYQVYVSFKSKQNMVSISKIIKNEICSDLSSLCRWYLMTQNYRVSTMLFLSEDENNKEKEIATQQPNKKKTLGAMHLFCTRINDESDFKAEKEKVLPTDWNDKDGNMSIKPLKELYSQLKHIDNCLNLDKWECKICRDIPDWLILGEMFGIKPLKSKLSQLIKTHSFRMFLKFSKYNGWYTEPYPQSQSQSQSPQRGNNAKSTITKRKKRKRQKYTMYNCNLSFFWFAVRVQASCMNLFGAINICCFSFFDTSIHNIQQKIPKPRGKHAFFSDLSCCGNFDYYQDFITYDDGKSTSHDWYQLKHGMLVMIAAFLKLEILIKFIGADANQINEMGYYKKFDFNCGEIMAFAINPNRLIELKETLTVPKCSLMRIGDESSISANAFDIIGNTAYHPNNRLHFMWHLCFSSTFASEFIDRINYEVVREWVIDSYSNFDYFVKFWHLNEYSDLKENKITQENIHFKYKSIIQYLFGLAFFYRCNNVKTALQESNNFNGYKENFFIDIKPSDQNEVIVLYDILKQQYTQEDLLQSLINPKVDIHFLNNFHVNKTPIQFDVVDDVCQFMKKLFDMSFAW